MWITRLLTAAALLSTATAAVTTAAVAQTVTLDVHYANPANGVKELHEELARMFTERNPNVQIRFRTAPNGYAPLTEQVLRAALVNNAPDVVFQGLNLLRTLFDRKLTAPLESFAAKDGGFEKLGYSAASLDLGRMGANVHALPFAISVPVLYVNGDLLRSAGYDPDKLATSWPDLIAAGKAIEAKNEKKTGFFFRYDVDGNWMLQALVFSNGGSMLSPDETKVAFTDGPGRFAFDTLESFARARMPVMTGSQARSAFGAGNIGIFADSSSNIESIGRAVGQRFEYRIAPVAMPNRDGRLPAGGNLAVMLAKDPKKQAAAWEYIKFVTGPVGQTLMATRTGYLPGNELALKDPEMLGKFFGESQNRAVTVAQLPRMTGWYAYPGKNALKIADVIQNNVDTTVTGKQTAQEAAVRVKNDVEALLKE